MPVDLLRLNQEIHGQIQSRKTGHEVTSRDGLFASTGWTLVFEAAQLQAGPPVALLAEGGAASVEPSFGKHAFFSVPSLVGSGTASEFGQFVEALV